MTSRIGIRLEDKNIWEGRTPIIPEHVALLRQEHNIEVVVQESPIRAFSNEEYRAAGARLAPTLEDCPIIFAVKEIPPALLEPRKTYVFFSHTIKGQRANMPMLRRLMELGCQLLDYERIVDAEGRRVVFFGNYAGLAGMIDTLWALGQRLAWEGYHTPFETLQPALHYRDLATAQAAIREVGTHIAQEGLPTPLTPLIFGFAGYGNVSRGAQQIFDLLPHVEISPRDLLTYQDRDPYRVVKVVFKEADMVEPVTPARSFELQDYYQHPEHYRSRFERYLPQLTVLVNGIFWSARYPRLVTRQGLQALFERESCPRLRVIGDISCDVEGAIECTLHTTTPGNPIFVYNPLTCETQDACAGTDTGVVILAVDNLPAELPREASTHFSTTLLPFIPAIVQADYSLPFEEANLPPILKRAIILWHGVLTPDYQYLEAYL